MGITIIAITYTALTRHYNTAFKYHWNERTL